MTAHLKFSASVRRGLSTISALIARDMPDYYKNHPDINMYEVAKALSWIEWKIRSHEAKPPRVRVKK